MDSDAIIAGLKRFNVPHERIAEVIGRDRTAATRMMGGKRSVKIHEVAGLSALIAEYEEAAGESDVVKRGNTLADQFDEGLLIEYVAVEVLPTYVGMGGGGTGDDERRKALLPRALLQELHAQPADLLVIEVRGTSMEPQFKQGDQIVIDRRDRDPRHGGPFALFDGDTFILKNIEQLPGPEGKLRVFSSAQGFSDWHTSRSEITIEGRPVWFARRL